MTNECSNAVISVPVVELTTACTLATHNVHCIYTAVDT